MTFYTELPPIIDRVPNDAAMLTLKMIAQCQERHIVSAPNTLQRKLGISEGMVRQSLLALYNDDMIAFVKSYYTDGNGGEDGRLGFKVLQKGWDRLGYKPLWIE